LDDIKKINIDLYNKLRVRSRMCTLVISSHPDCRGQVQDTRSRRGRYRATTREGETELGGKTQPSGDQVSARCGCIKCVFCEGLPKLSVSIKMPKNVALNCTTTSDGR
jgi:hypothetical protein